MLVVGIMLHVPLWQVAVSGNPVLARAPPPWHCFPRPEVKESAFRNSEISRERVYRAFEIYKKFKQD